MGRKKKKKNKNKVKLFPGILLLLIIIGALLFLIDFESYVSPPSTDERRVSKSRPRDDIPSRKEVPAGQRKPRTPKKLAVVIDDIGHDLQTLEALLQIKAPITLSILPHCRYTRESAEKARREGREILLHLPMEPHGYPERNPGKGALLIVMDDDQLRRELAENIRAVPHIVGVNNHMGSRFMEAEAKVKTVFESLRRENLFFLDSRTTRNSKASAAAASTGIRLIVRDAFIDNGGDPEETYRELLHVVRQKGDWKRKVVIGHPYPGTIAALRRAVKILPAEGIEIVPVSRLP